MTSAVESEPAAAAAAPMGHESHLYLPGHSAAHTAAGDLARMGHLLVTVGPCDDAIRDRLTLPEGWWWVASLAANMAETHEALHWVMCQVTIGVERVARAHGGFVSGGRYGHLPSEIRRFPREGLVHDGTGHIDNPAGVRPQAPTPPAPPLPLGDSGGTVDTLVDAVRATANRLYGDGTAAVPEHVEWLFEEDYFDEPFSDSEEFMHLWVETVSSDGQGSDVTAEAAPYVAALAADDAVAPPIRGSLLSMLLGTVADQHRNDVCCTDLCELAGGHETEDARATRLTIEAEVPRLLARWDTETDANRLLLAALATLVPAHARPHVAPRLADIPTPPATRRADVVALISDLLHDNPADALRTVAAWDGNTAILTAYEADPRTTSIAALHELVNAEVAVSSPDD
ncbi:MAG TPA: hypothetical protein VLH10_18415 [Yinghuangia sp.]|nr:hypothetical protein [Yinghuangia sp.]